jgi:hypothetical protein
MGSGTAQWRLLPLCTRGNLLDKIANIGHLRGSSEGGIPAAKVG